MNYTVEHLDGTPRYLYLKIENSQEGNPVMHKRVFFLTAVALALALCLAACGKKPADDTKPNTALPDTSDTTELTDPTDTEGTEGTEGSAGADDPTKPTLESDTEVGSGRVEGSSGSQTGDNKPTSPTEEPTTPSQEPTTPDTALSMNYQQYMALSGKEQQAFFDKYFSDNPLGFANWFRKIKQEYDDGRTEIEATGPIDIGDYINP